MMYSGRAAVPPLIVVLVIRGQVSERRQYGKVDRDSGGLSSHARNVCRLPAVRRRRENQSGTRGQCVPSRYSVPSSSGVIYVKQDGKHIACEARGRQHGMLAAACGQTMNLTSFWLEHVGGVQSAGDPR
jgi:hypothetical protein